MYFNTWCFYVCDINRQAVNSVNPLPENKPHITEGD